MISTLSHQELSQKMSQLLKKQRQQLITESELAELTLVKQEVDKRFEQWCNKEI